MPRSPLLHSSAKGAGAALASGSLGSQRAAVVLANSGSAALFAWAACVLPSRPGSLPALLLAGLAVAHLGTLSIALLVPGRLRSALRKLSWLSLAMGALFSALLALTALEMVQRFASLGVGVSVLLGLIGVLVLLATVPFGLWGLRATGGPRGWR